MQTGHWGFDMVTVGGWTVNASVAVSNKAFNWGLGMDGIMGFMPAWRRGDPQPWWVTAALSGWPEYEFGMHLVRSPHPYKVQEGLPDSGDLSLG
jgi:hypothetical protein